MKNCNNIALITGKVCELIKASDLMVMIKINKYMKKE